jgi:hypothetical protein
MKPCCIKPRNLYNVFESLLNRCFANRTDRSRVISYHSRDIGVDSLLFCNHYKNHERGYVQYHDMEWYPVCVDQFDKAAVCGSSGHVFESTSHIP